VQPQTEVGQSESRVGISSAAGRVPFGSVSNPSGLAGPGIRRRLSFFASASDVIRLGTRPTRPGIRDTAGQARPSATVPGRGINVGLIQEFVAQQATAAVVVAALV
jgi:hypothetical protein